MERQDPSGKVFYDKCRKLKSLNSRKCFDKEINVRQIHYYTVQQLLGFALRDKGKEDDIAVCTAILQD